MNPLDPFHLRQRVVDSLLYEKVQGEMWAIIDVAIKKAVERYAKTTLENLVERVADEELPKSEHHAAIREEWQRQVQRWPAIQSDQQMQLNVARTILRSFVK